MPLLRALAPLACAALLGGCDMNEYFPTQTAGGAGASGAFSFTDPAGDLRPNADAATAPDAVGLTGRVSEDTVTIKLSFRAPIARYSAARPNSLDGFVDLDVDESTDTGIPPAVDEEGGQTGMGADYYVSLRDLSDGFVGFMAVETQQATRVPAQFDAASVTIRIPRTLLDDEDGRFRVSAVVGHPAQAATDFVPNSGYLTVAPAR